MKPKLKLLSGYNIACALTLAVVSFCAPFLGHAGADVIYAASDANSPSDGASWEGAYNHLQDAIDNASDGDEVWVKAGLYRPNDDNPSDISRTQWFQLKNNAAVYGGFAGTETDRSQRDPAAHETILSGDIGVPGDNCYHVFYHPVELALDASAQLDGVIIADGNANGSYPNNCGGGMANIGAFPNLKDCILSENSAEHGGGMENILSFPTLDNCTFKGNNADRGGGGMENIFSSPELSNCLFSGNAAEWGGGMRNILSSPHLADCTFTENAADWGDGMGSILSSPELSDCLFVGNDAEWGWGM